ncbi:MAG: hypothetical protein ACOC40_02955, partial [Thermoplasmatota archaeon]
HNGGVSPKDEYLAVLEKGETVIPPEELDKNTMQQEIYVHGKIQGEDIYLSQNEYLRRKRNTL